MTHPDEVARLNATTDVIATRLESLVMRVEQLENAPPELKADAESLKPMVAVLRQMGADPADPVPPASALPAAVVAPPSLGPVLRGDGQPLPAPQGSRHER
jgi:hypothetical protein